MEPGVRRLSIKYLQVKLINTIIGKVHPDWPWWSSSAVKLCEQLIKPTDQVFEFGSGKSTLWFAKRCCKTFSVEHDKKWFDFINNEIVRNYYTDKIELYFCPLEHGVSNENQKYLSHLIMKENSTLDIIVVDGKLRASSAFLSIDKLKHGGILIIDDVHRYLPRKSGDVFPESSDKETWELVYSKINEWRQIFTTDGVHATAFYFKP